ncbi:hypothetical protein LJB77_02475, partial [Ruminococcaceae bacterium OttesenSCG-928-N02]|nr:hypothetical protein [Ruminococcaceae bacterium OttesenSCG-928-N02]
NKTNVGMVSALAVAIILFIDLVFNYMMRGMGGLLAQLLRISLPTVGYTFLAGMLCFFPVRHIHRRFRID